MGRSALTTGQTAERLGCKRQNVDDLYRRKRLKGPKRLPGSPILIWEDEVVAYERERAAGSRPAKTGTDETISHLDLRSALDRIEARLEGLQHSVDRLEADRDSQATAVASLLGIQDELRSALAASDKANDHLVQFLAATGESRAALLRADELRDAVLLDMSTPGTVPGGR